MSSKIHKILDSYRPSAEYNTKVAYFSMEFAIDQPLKIYSGGLGFLAGSHMRSAYELKQNVIGIGILWKNGYYDQTRNYDGYLEPEFTSKDYFFLEDTEFTFPITIHNNPVHVKAFLVKPETFGTAPVFLLTTDVPENDHLSRTITYNLYDNNEATRIAQSIVLGVGGAKLLDLLGLEIAVYHLNEGHALPLVYYLYNKYKTKEDITNRLVFTTHTPEMAGNEEHHVDLLEEMSFFCDIPVNEATELVESDGHTINYTLAALKLAKRANAVSKLHKEVTDQMWGQYSNICEIIGITNAQNQKYWQDPVLKQALDSDNDILLTERKKELKKELFKIVADQTGKLFDPNVLTVVWARRFAGYKRAWLILQEFDQFLDLVNRENKPIQVIWAGKPYPKSNVDVDLFNHILHQTKYIKRCAVLLGYEMALSGILKKGSDIWLNTPRYTREASGTSGMTAAMNGSVNLTIADGWIPEFAKDGHNSFLIEMGDLSISQDNRDHQEGVNLMRKLRNDVIPTYYDNQSKWNSIVKNAMREVVPQFESGRMAKEYYEQLYNYRYQARTVHKPNKIAVNF
jgi:glycogen phosphorylase